MTSDRISIACQMQLLLEHTAAPNKRPSTIATLARAMGLSQQTLQNILQGRIDNPRLDTLRVLCQFYGISLDYFDLPTEERCRHYLAAKQLTSAAPVMQHIQRETHDLTEQGQRNILSALEWINAASPSQKS